jgi:aspartokinase/homoserine dehydrogenase 1
LEYGTLLFGRVSSFRRHNDNMRILKFGGSSVGTPERILRVVSVIRGAAEKHGPVCIVASAFQGVTDQLVEMSKRALTHDPYYEDMLRTLEIRHMETVAH